ncbi:PQQ-dependent sugar dehydrogenase [Demequina mangrovi]|uniref:Glucose/arabinose dehydrogenase, beta-propeller fold n=1 Tax=Demequina mangrovi TaxID=1043493 RepID=A0A1H6ZEP0_9MICO|nr:PQQ-dependent sugar dehydrogenase [Demequina mangrovi]SEJ50594.1 Glucose/arabinose dehydrogenase, beta-propeller fold [Demequina mangrovi]
MSFSSRIVALACALPLTLTACSSADAGESAPSASRIVSGTVPSTTADPVELPTEIGGPVTASVLTEEVVAKGLTTPSAMVTMADGSLLVSERTTATIRRVRAGIATSLNGPGVEALRSMANAEHSGGLLGIAVLPGDTTYVYAYVTRADDNAVVRMELHDELLGQPTVIVDGIPAGEEANGGRLAFGPDGFLYIGTGDAGRPQQAVNTKSLSGKILRVVANGGDRDGAGAKGNPFGSRVWSLGHHDVTGIAWVADGRMYASDRGDTSDELNLIVAGGDYGWPASDGLLGLPSGTGLGETAGEVTAPVAVWDPADATPGGIAATHEGIYVSAVSGDRVWRLPLTEDTTGEPHVLLDGLGSIRSVLTGDDGMLYVLTGNTDGGKAAEGDDRVVRITVG